MNNEKPTCIDCKDFRDYTTGSVHAGICVNPACTKAPVKHIMNPACKHFVEKKTGEIKE